MGGGGCQRDVKAVRVSLLNFSLSTLSSYRRRRGSSRSKGRSNRRSTDMSTHSRRSMERRNRSHYPCTLWHPYRLQRQARLVRAHRALKPR